METKGDNRQKLLDELGRVLGELFADGLDEQPDNVKRMVLELRSGEIADAEVRTASPQPKATCTLTTTVH